MEWKGWPKLFQFTIQGEAVSWRAPTVGVVKGRRVSFSNKLMKGWQESIWGQVMAHAPPEPLQGPIDAKIRFNVSMPRSWPQWRRDALVGRPCVQKKRRDPGNLAKLLLDVLEGIFYVDDGQAFKLLVTKQWTAEPHHTGVSLLCYPPQPEKKSDLADWQEFWRRRDAV